MSDHRESIDDLWWCVRFAVAIATLGAGVVLGLGLTAAWGTNHGPAGGIAGFALGGALMLASAWILAGVAHDA